MRCEFCEFAIECSDPAQFGGGCDIDGADDFGCGSGEVFDDDPCHGGDCQRHQLGAEPCTDCPYCDEKGNI